jgi:phage tail sheath protein FI
VSSFNGHNRPMTKRDHAEFLAEADQLVAAATAHVAGLRARIDDFKRNGLHTRAAQEMLETLEGNLELLQRQRDIIAHLVEMGARQDC